MDQYIAR